MQDAGAQSVALLRRRRQARPAPGQLKLPQPVGACKKWKVGLPAHVHPVAWQPQSHKIHAVQMQLQRFKGLLRQTMKGKGISGIVLCSVGG